ncbi:hypothetical protein EV424DRAFT_1348400 [Suillus variegatus]|nr:hypothetical protein EV424DRAFT_1348400 [Suillus variegatus]
MHGDRRHKPDAGETAVGRPRAAYVEGDTRVQQRETITSDFQKIKPPQAKYSMHAAAVYPRLCTSVSRARQEAVKSTTLQQSLKDTLLCSAATPRVPYYNAVNASIIPDGNLKRLNLGLSTPDDVNLTL